MNSSEKPTRYFQSPMVVSVVFYGIIRMVPGLGYYWLLSVVCLAHGLLHVWCNG